MKPTIEVHHDSDAKLIGCIVDGSKAECEKDGGCVWKNKQECYGERVHHKLVASQNQQPKDYDYDLPRAKAPNDTGTG